MYGAINYITDIDEPFKEGKDRGWVIVQGEKRDMQQESEKSLLFKSAIFPKRESV